MKNRIEFKRDIGLFMAVMVGIGAMMGPGIFALPGELAHMVGPLGIFVYLAMGAVTIFTALNYAELGAAIPLAGGGYSFVSRTLGKPIAFFTGWFLWIGNTLACAMYAIIFSLAIRAYIWPGASIVLLTTATTAVFLVTNLRGMSESIKVITVMNLIELVILVGIGLLGLAKIEAPNLQPLAPMGFEPFIPAMALIYISYVGFDLITVAAEEIKDPGKTIPRAILITLGVGIAIYVFVVTVMMGTVHYEELAGTDVPFVYSAERILGGWGRWAGITATIMASLSAFSVTLGASARILYALGRDRHFPAVFERLHPTYQTPDLALVVCAVIVIVFGASGIVRFVASVADFGYLMGLGIVNCAVIALHRTMPNLRRPFKGFLYPWVPILGALSCWAFVPALEPKSLVLGLLLTAVGAGIYLLQPANRRELGRLAGVGRKLTQWVTTKARKKMRVLIIGGGRHGRSVANQLLNRDEYRLMFRSAEHQITFVENDEAHCQELEQQYNAPIFQGDGTKADLLRQVGLGQMDVAVAALGDDDHNLIAALQVKRLGVPSVIALVDEPDYIPLLEEEGVVPISTHKASAIMVENYLERPDVAELFELGKGEGGLAGVVLDDHAAVVGETVETMGLPKDCIVAAVIRGRHFIVPSGDTEIRAGDRLLFAGLTAAIKKAREMCMVERAGEGAARGSLSRLIERMRPGRSDALDRQLREALEVGHRGDKDPLADLVGRAIVLDFKRDTRFEEIVREVARPLARRVGLSAAELESELLEGNRVDLAPLTGGIAIPHLRIEGLDQAEMALVRALRGVDVGPPADDPDSTSHPTNAFFFLVSPDEDPAQHLRILARIAERVNSDQFMKDWLTADGEDDLKQSLVEQEHFFVLQLREETRSSELVGRAIRDLQMPEETLVTVIHRGSRIVVPRGETVLQSGDRLTIVGDSARVKAYCARFDQPRVG